MKQYLLPTDLTSCPQEVRTKLVEFCKKNKIYTWKTENGQMERIEPDEYNLPLLNTGQLIQFILENDTYIHEQGEEHWEGYPHVSIGLPDNFLICIRKDKELIDVLWEKVKGGGKDDK